MEFSHLEHYRFKQAYVSFFCYIVDTCHIHLIFLNLTTSATLSNVVQTLAPESCYTFHLPHVLYEQYGSVKSRPCLSCHLESPLILNKVSLSQKFHLFAVLTVQYRSMFLHSVDRPIEICFCTVLTDQ